MLAFRRMDKKEMSRLGDASFQNHADTHQHDDGKDAVKDRQDLREIGHGGDEPSGRGVDDENGDGQPQSQRLDGFERSPLLQAPWGT